MAEYKILVVDDEDETLRFLQRTLRRALKCPVDTAQSADEGIEKLLKNNYALVVLDIKMPGKSGLDFMREVKAKGELPKVLIVTGYDDESVLRETLDAGALDYIPKPVVSEQLILKIQSRPIDRRCPPIPYRRPVCFGTFHH